MPPDAPPVVAPETPSPDAPQLPSGHEEAFGALDAMAKEFPSTADVPPPRLGDRPRGADGKFLKPGEKPPEKTPEKKPDAKSDSKADSKAETKATEIDFEKPPEKAGELRKHYDALKVKHRELETKHAELQKSATAPKEWPEKKTYEEKLAEREKVLADHAKRVADYENELRFVRYEKSEEYRTKYEKPFTDAFLAGRDRASKLKIVERKTDADPSTGQEGRVIQQSRQGKAEDFDEIMRIADDDMAAERAMELYGPAKAPLILYHRRLLAHCLCIAQARFPMP